MHVLSRETLIWILAGGKQKPFGACMTWHGEIRTRGRRGGRWFQSENWPTFRFLFWNNQEWFAAQLFFSLSRGLKWFLSSGWLQTNGRIEEDTFFQPEVSSGVFFPLSFLATPLFPYITADFGLLSSNILQQIGLGWWNCWWAQFTGFQNFALFAFPVSSNHFARQRNSERAIFCSVLLAVAISAFFLFCNEPCAFEPFVMETEHVSEFSTGCSFCARPRFEEKIVKNLLLLLLSIAQRTGNLQGPFAPSAHTNFLS